MLQTLRIRVIPSASRNHIAGWRDGELRVKVQAPPERGRANLAVGKLLARALGIKKGAIRIVRGEKDRRKLIEVYGLALHEIQERLIVSLNRESISGPGTGRQAAKLPPPLPGR